MALNADQVLSTLNAAWKVRGEAAFALADADRSQGVVACSDGQLCVQLIGEAARLTVVRLSGPVATRPTSQRYLSAQSLLVQLTAPGAPFRPVVTADRLAVGDTRPADAQLGPTCMHVEVSAGTMSTSFSRRRCAPE